MSFGGPGPSTEIVFQIDHDFHHEDLQEGCLPSHLLRLPEGVVVAPPNSSNVTCWSFDNDQDVPPARPESGEGDPEEPARMGQARAWMSMLEGRELLP
jgi:hypothetical protein